MSHNPVKSQQRGNANGMIGGAIVVFSIILITIFSYYTRDVCPNIDGAQKRVPFGYHVLEAGDTVSCVINTVSFPPTPPQPPEFPTAGEGYPVKEDSTKEVGIKAYLDPNRSKSEKSGPVRFVFVKDRNLYFDETKNWKEMTNQEKQKWWDMPIGEYLVYSIDRDQVWFKWWLQ